MILQVMARGRNLNVLRTINSLKHIVDSQGGLALNTQSVTPIIQAVDNPVNTSVTQVHVGSKVNGIFLTVEAYSTSSSGLGNIYMLVMKNPGNNLTTPVANTVGDEDTKKFIFFQKMRMMEKSTAGNPRTLIDGWLSIPKRYRRFGVDDRLNVALLVPTGGNTADFCLQSIYKEYY